MGGNPAGDALKAAASTVDPTGGVATGLAAPVMDQVGSIASDPAAAMNELGNALVENGYNILKGQGDQAAAQVGNVSGQNYEATFAAFKLFTQGEVYSEGFSSKEIDQIKLLLSAAERAAHNKAENEAKIISGVNKAKEESGKGGNTGMGWGVGLGIALAVGGVALTIGTAGIASPVGIGLMYAGIASAGGILGGLVGNKAGRTAGGWGGWKEGSSTVDERIAGPLEEKYKLDAFAKFYSALEQSNPALFQKLELALAVPKLEQGVLNAMKDPNSNQEQKDQAAKAFVVGAIKFRATSAMNSYEGKLNEDILKTMVMQGSPKEGKEYFKAMIGAKGRALTPKEEEDFALMYAYGSFLKDPDQKLDWMALYNSFVEAKSNPAVDPYVAMAEQLPSRRNTGFSGLINQLFGRISAFFHELWKPETDFSPAQPSQLANAQNNTELKPDGQKVASAEMVPDKVARVIQNNVTPAPASASNQSTAYVPKNIQPSLNPAG